MRIIQWIVNYVQQIGPRLKALPGNVLSSLRRRVQAVKNLRLDIGRIGRIEIEIVNGVVDVVSATSNPNQICVYAAPISEASWNPNIICAPNRLTIRIIGGAPIVDVII